MARSRKWRPVVFRDGSYGVVDAERFKTKCANPRFVADCLVQYQKWRRGEGEYGAVGMDAADPPFSPAALSIVENCAVAHLMRLHATYNDKGGART